MTTISASEARQTLPAQLDRVPAGEQVAISRPGRIVAMLVHPDAVRPPRTAAAWRDADALAELLEAARATPLRTARMTRDRVDELVEAVHADRAGR